MSARRYRLACGVDGTGCQECDERVNESVRSLEANVDQKYLLADSYRTSICDGISRCSVHGREVRPVTWEGLAPPYRTIVADPPWEYNEGFVQGTSHGVGRLDVVLPYSSMTLEDIADLPVQDLADPGGAFLFLWTTNKYLPDAFDVIAAWGFRYRQCLVWSKGDASPFARSVAPNSGEFLLVARRGGVKRIGTAPASILHAVRGGHSAKPDVFTDLIQSVAPGPYVELFAREPRLGWDHWGFGYEQEAS